MRRFLRHFVTLPAHLGVLLLLALAGPGVSACGVTGGGGGTLAVACGVGGVCPAGFKCGANGVCIGAGVGADGTAGTDAAGTDDAGTTGDSAVISDISPDTGAADVAPADVPLPDVAKDTAKPDVVTADVQTGKVTVASLQQATAECTSPDMFVDVATDVVLEDVVVTSPSTTLKGSGGAYFTSFFARPKSGAASDGQWAGMQVIVEADPFVVAVGDVLQISGTIKEFYCMTEIVASPENVQNLGSLAAPVPAKLLMSQLDGTAAEPWEGALVQISNVQVIDPNPIATDGKTHGEATISHNGGAVTIALAPAYGSAFLAPSSGGTTTLFSTDQPFASVTGNLQWSFGHWVLRARSDADLVLK